MSAAASPHTKIIVCSQSNTSIRTFELRLKMDRDQASMLQITGGPLEPLPPPGTVNPWKARQGADSTESRNTIAPKNHNTRKNREHTRKLYNSYTTEGGKER